MASSVEMNLQAMQGMSIKHNDAASNRDSEINSLLQGINSASKSN